MVSLAIIQVPYTCGDARHPNSRGPEAFMRSGLAEMLVDKGIAVSARRIAEGMPFTDSLGSSLANCRELTGVVRSVVGAGEMPLVLAGSCDVSKGVLSGIDHERCGVIWLDAHGDFNTPESSISGHLPGMSLALIVGQCHREHWAQIGNNAPVPEEAVLLLGVRDLDTAERKRLHQSSVQMIEWRNGRPEQDVPAALDRFATRIGEVYVHVDLDVFCPQDGGVSRGDLAIMVRKIASRFRVRAATLAGYNPDNDSDKSALETGVEIVSALADGLLERRTK
jgi:arginase